MLLCFTRIFILYVYQFEDCSLSLMVFPTSLFVALNYICLRPLSFFPNLMFIAPHTSPKGSINLAKLALQYTMFHHLDTLDFI